MENSLNHYQYLEALRARLGDKRYEEIRGISYESSWGELKLLFMRRSLFVVEDMAKGEEFTEENVRSIRPYHGLHCRYLKDILGKRATQDIQRGTPLNWGLIEDIR